jgi:hypothetical protein
MYDCTSPHPPRAKAQPAHGSEILLENLVARVSRRLASAQDGTLRRRPLLEGAGPARRRRGRTTHLASWTGPQVRTDSTSPGRGGTEQKTRRAGKVINYFSSVYCIRILVSQPLDVVRFHARAVYLFSYLLRNFSRGIVPRESLSKVATTAARFPLKSRERIIIL